MIEDGLSLVLVRFRMNQGEFSQKDKLWERGRERGERMKRGQV